MLTARGDIVEGVQAPDVSAEVLPQLQPIKDALPYGYRIETGGAIEESAKANVALFAVFPVMGIVMLVAASWVAVAARDRDVAILPQTEAERIAAEHAALLLAARVRLRTAKDARAQASWFRRPFADRAVREAEEELRQVEASAPPPPPHASRALTSPPPKAPRKPSKRSPKASDAAKGEKPGERAAEPSKPTGYRPGRKSAKRQQGKKKGGGPKA